MNKVFAVRTEVQKVLFQDELIGQLSDGRWENARPTNHWCDWAEAEVLVDAEKPGVNFSPRKSNYAFEEPELLEIVGDRMIEKVEARLGKKITMKELKRELADIRTCMKLWRGS